MKLFRLLLVGLVGLAGVTALSASDWYLFTSFRGNGETGVFLALSPDGRTWTPLNNNRPWIKPEAPGMLMRDPWLQQGPDGLWHMIWTWGWTRGENDKTLKIGYAESRDLIHWSPQRAIPVMPGEPTARNAWAPEAVYDAARKEWIVFWASTIPGRFPASDASGDDGYNHRIYAMTTKDWKSFSAPRLFFDPGYNCIDATIARDGSRWILIFKDERKDPLVKRLKYAVANSPAGPWREISEPFTPSWNEGPSAVQIGADWWIYFDHYVKPAHYAAVRTRDWKSFEDMSGQVTFPADHRHGTVVRIPEATAKALQAEKR